MEKQKLLYDVIIGHNLMKYLQMDVLYSEDVVVWYGVRLPIHKIQNEKWTDFNLMYQEDPEAIQEKSIWLGIILDANYEKADLEQDIIKLIHLNEFQRVILLSCLKRYKYLLDGNIGGQRC